MPERTYDAWRSLLAKESLPAAVVDLDAVDHNLRVLRRGLGERVTLRVASKSVRHTWLLEYILGNGATGHGTPTGIRPMRGLMTFTAREARYLVEQGFDDLLAGYPVGRAEDAAVFAALTARGANVVATIDALEHVPLLEHAAAQLGVKQPVCIDVDMSWRPGDRFHLGVRRSPIHDASNARRVARAVAESSHLELRALLAYEAQIAGIRDTNPGSRLLDPVRQMIKRASKPVVLARRKAVLDAFREDGHAIEIVNGGGTGSLAFTAADPSVTEVTVGSGFLCPHLFTGYTDLDLRPAVFFAIPMVRRPAEGFITCAGGGYLASGAAASDRLPVVHSPNGLEPLGMEGWGEVQTPFKTGRETPRLHLGDPIIARHAKSGELAERFNEYIFVRGEEIVDRQPTYRGAGHSFM